MKNWSADFVNDPNDDYNIIAEIYCNSEEIGVIRKMDDVLKFRIYSRGNDIDVPAEWLAGLLNELRARRES